MIVRKSVRLFTIAACIGLSLSACSDNSKTISDVNALLPKVDTTLAQSAAIRTSIAQLNLLNDPNAYIGISAEDLSRYLPKTILAQLHKEDKTPLKLSELGLSFQQQQITVNGEFQFPFDSEGSTATGLLQISCAPAIVNSVLVLRPTTSVFVLKKLSYKGSAAPAIVAGAVSAALRPLLPVFDRAISAQAIPLTAYRLDAIDLQAEIQKQLTKLQAAPNNSGLKVLEMHAAPVQLSIALGRASVLIEPAGVHVIGEVVSLSPVVVGEIMKELQVLGPKVSLASLSSRQVALVSTCQSRPDSKMTAQAIAANVADYDQVCKTFSPMLQQVATSDQVADGSPPAAALSQAFENLAATFHGKVSKIDSADRIPWSQTAVALSKVAFATIVNRLLEQMSFSADFSLADFGGAFQKTIITDPPPDLKCSQNAGGCDSDFSYPPFTPPGCDSNCGIDPVCAAKKFACETGKQGQKTGYEAAKATAQAGFAAKKALCEAGKELKKKGCEINQGWLNTVNGLDLGEIRGTWKAVNPRGQLNVTGLTVAEGFSGATANVGLSGSVAVQAEYTLTPHNLGNVVCIKEAKGGVNANLLIQPQHVPLIVKLQSVQREKTRLDFRFSLAEVPLDISSSPPALRALYDQNIGTLTASCPAPGALLATMGPWAPVAIGASLGFGPGVDNPVYHARIPASEFVAKLEPIRLKIGVDERENAQEIEIAASWNEASVVFAKP